MSIVECPVCLDFFGWEDKHRRAPRVLPCGHTICNSCLIDISQRDPDNEFLCPVCRQEISKDKAIEKIPINRFVYDVLREKGLIESGEDNIMEEKYDLSFEIIFLGISGVGKTSIIDRYTNENFTLDRVSSVGTDIKIKTIQARKKTVRFKIRDTAGQERYSSMCLGFLRGANGAFFVYDCTNKHSLEKLEFYIKNFMNQNNTKARAMILVANKIDLENREVSQDEGMGFADKYKMSYFETSAKSGVGVDLIFKNIGIKLMKEFDKFGNEIESESHNISLNMTISKKKKIHSKCC